MSRSTSNRARRMIALGAVICIAIGSLAAGTVAAQADELTASIVTGSPSGTGVPIEYGGALYLAAGTGLAKSIYRFDGTTFTQVPGSPQTSGTLVEFDGLLYFAGTGASGLTLYSFDGTTFTDLASPTFPSTPVVNGGVLYVAASLGFGQSVVYSFDGTSFVAVPGSPTHVSTIHAQAGHLLVGDGGATPQVYDYDGTNFTSILAGRMDQVVEFNGTMYLAADLPADGTHPYGLYSYVPGSAPVLVPGTPSHVGSPAIFNGLLYFGGNEGGDGVLYRTDGTSIEAVPGSPLEPQSMTTIGGRLYVSAFTDTNHDVNEVFVLDGSSLTGIPDSGFFSRGFVEFDGSVYYTANTALEGGTALLHRIDIAVTDPAGAPAASPTLAVTGVDISLLSLLAGSLILAGAAVLVVRRSRAV